MLTLCHIVLFDVDASQWFFNISSAFLSCCFNVLCCIFVVAIIITGMHWILALALAGPASGHFSQIRCWPNFQINFAAFHCSHNGCGAEMLIFLKYNSRRLNLDWNPKNWTMTVTLITVHLPHSFCWSASDVDKLAMPVCVHKLVWSDFMQPRCICSPQFLNLAPASAPARFEKLESVHP